MARIPGAVNNVKYKVIPLPLPITAETIEEILNTEASALKSQFELHQIQFIPGAGNFMILRSRK